MVRAARPKEAMRKGPHDIGLAQHSEQLVLVDKPGPEADFTKGIDLFSKHARTWAWMGMHTKRRQALSGLQVAGSGS